MVFAGSSSTATLQSTNILALDTILAVISSLGGASYTDHTLDHTLSLPSPSSLPDLSSVDRDSAHMSASAGLIFSTTQEEGGRGMSEREVCLSEPNLLTHDTTDEPISPGTSSELLKSRQLKKVHKYIILIMISDVV